MVQINFFGTILDQKHLEYLKGMSQAEQPRLGQSRLDGVP